MKIFLKEFDHLNELRHAEGDMMSIGMPTVILGIFALCYNVSILENI